MEGDAPWGFPGVCIDGVFRGSFEFVVMEGGDEQERFFVGFVEDGKALEGFYSIEVSEFVGFFSAQFLAEEELFGGGVCEAPDHWDEDTPNGESFKRRVRFSVY